MGAKCCSEEGKEAGKDLNASYETRAIVEQEEVVQPKPPPEVKKEVPKPELPKPEPLKEEPKKAPEPPPKEFTVTLTKTAKSRLGVDVDLGDSVTLLVESVND